eukprot:g59329.t1
MCLATDWAQLQHYHGGARFAFRRENGKSGDKKAVVRQKDEQKELAVSPSVYTSGQGHIVYHRTMCVAEG